AYGGPQFQVLQQALDRFSQAVEKSGVEIVPRMVITGGGGNGENGQGGGYSAFEALMAMILSDKLDVEAKTNGDGNTVGDDEIKRIRSSIMQGLAAKSVPTAAAEPPALPESTDGGDKADKAPKGKK